MVYRATVIGGKVVGVLRREPPHVIGDGTYTVKELIEQENKNPLRHGSIFHTLVVGPEAHTELKRQQLTLDSIPSAGQMVSLNQKVSRGEGASNSDVTDETHPDNIQLFEKIGQVLEDPLVGIDFIIPDMTNSWQEQDCGVIECNAMPFIDLHHYPLTGKPRDAAGALWDLVFPDKKTP
jgi:cyanophycin synthetase